MTSSKMENPLWKKLQNDPALLKQFNVQQNQITNLLDNPTGNSNDSNGLLQGVMSRMSSGNGNNFIGADSIDEASDSGGGLGDYQSMSSNMNEFTYYQNVSQSSSPSVQKKNGSKLTSKFFSSYFSI